MGGTGLDNGSSRVAFSTYLVVAWLTSTRISVKVWFIRVSTLEHHEPIEEAKMRQILAVAMVVTIGFVTGCSPSGPPVSFKQDVFPILLEYCSECHAMAGKGFERTGLRLGSYAQIMAGSDSGPVVVPGIISKSPIVVYIHPSPDANLSMPHNKPTRLSKREIQTIERWIGEGAKNN